MINITKTGLEPAILDWHGACEEARGVWGHAPPQIFFKSGTLRSLLRPCLGQNATRISLPVVSVARELSSSEVFAV